MGWNQQNTAHIPKCMLKLWIKSQEGIWKKQLTPRIPFMHELSRLLSTARPKEQHLLFTNSVLIQEIASLSSTHPTPLICTQCKFFQNNLYLYLPYLTYFLIKIYQGWQWLVKLHRIVEETIPIFYMLFFKKVKTTIKRNILLGVSPSILCQF